MKKLFLLAAILATLIYSTTATAQTLVADSSFGANGLSIPNLEFDVDWSGKKSAVLQADGKILVIYLAPTTVGYGFVVVSRLNSDGSVDTGFGTNGSTSFYFEPVLQGSLSLNGIRVQADGKIIVGGTAEHLVERIVNGTPTDVYERHLALARLNANGSMDNSFGNSGIVLAPTNEGMASLYGLDSQGGVQIQSDGKIVSTCSYSAQSSNPNPDGFLTMRFNTDGSLDQSFGTTGQVYTSFGTEDAAPGSLAIQNDGKIVVNGSVDHDNGLDVDFAMVRYNSNGSIDNSFGTGGKIITDFGSDPSLSYALRIQPDGKIVSAGRLGPWSGGSSIGLACARFDQNGNLDNSFGVGGKLTYAPSNWGGETARVSFDPDGKVMSIVPHWVLYRMDADGAMDNSFGTDGELQLSASGLGFNTLSSMNGLIEPLVQNDGKIIVIGTTNDRLYLIRLKEPETNTNGVNDMDATALNMSLFPNPATEKLTLTYSLLQEEKISISIHSILGEKIHTFVTQRATNAGEQMETISVLPSHLANGQYLMTISTKTQMASMPFQLLD